MAQTPAGAVKQAARLLGIPVDEYQANVAAGQKWCSGCKTWHGREAFGSDRARPDGLTAACTESRNRRARELYRPRGRPEAGRRYAAARDGDRLQARRRVNHLVDVGVLPNPNDVACTDCGHRGSGRRHEYDHYLGYAAEHHEDVEATCSACHHRREKRRGR